MKSSTLILLALTCLSLGTQRSAEAAPVLSCDSSNYVVRGGQTIQVQVFLSQTAGGPQVGPTNTLLTAGIQVSFNNPSGVAAVLSTSNIVGGPAFDPTYSTGLTNTQA